MCQYLKPNFSGQGKQLAYYSIKHLLIAWHNCDEQTEDVMHPKEMDLFYMQSAECFPRRIKLI